MLRPLHWLALAGISLSLTLTQVYAAEKPHKTSAQTQLNLYVDAREAWQLLQKHQDALLVDVRDPIEIKFTGMATETDIHVPWMLADVGAWDEQQQSWAMRKNPHFMTELLQKLEAHQANQQTPIIVMCRSGSTRSAPVVDELAQRGYTQVWTVTDGFEGDRLKTGDSKGVRALNGWRNAGLPWSYKIDPKVAWQPKS